MNEPMRNPRQGEIYFWPDVPTEHPMGPESHRWVVVSSNTFNEHAGHVLACPVTSYPPREIDVVLRRTPHNSLQRDSAMIAAMITPIPKSMLSSAIGRVDKRTVGQVVDRLSIIVNAD